jgi:transcriptional repressor NrdR
MVVKSDHRRQEWNPDKLRRSLQVACTKRPISAETIERTVEQIEAELRSRDTAEVPSSVIGDLAMEKLRQLDQVAYIRFASVYRAFADISSFEDEVRRLIERARLNGVTGGAAPAAPDLSDLAGGASPDAVAARASHGVETSEAPLGSTVSGASESGSPHRRAAGSGAQARPTRTGASPGAAGTR